MDGLVARLPELDALGIRTILVGNGPTTALAGFVRHMALARRAVTVVTDPSLAAFRAAELARPPFHGLRAAVEAIRELAAGYAPGPVLGDALQLGGAFLVDTRGRVVYHHRSRSPGDLVDSSDIVHMGLALLVEQRGAGRRV